LILSGTAEPLQVGNVCLDTSCFSRTERQNAVASGRINGLGGIDDHEVATGKERGIVMTTVAPTLPPTSELFMKAKLVERHPNLLSLNRLDWALRHRASNGLAGAVYESRSGELLDHESQFLQWYLGLSGRAKPRSGRAERNHRPS
jgi:hypothetical protein